MLHSSTISLTVSFLRFFSIKSFLAASAIVSFMSTGIGNAPARPAFCMLRAARPRCFFVSIIPPNIDVFNLCYQSRSHIPFPSGGVASPLFPNVTCHSIIGAAKIRVCKGMKMKKDEKRYSKKYRDL